MKKIGFCVLSLLFFAACNNSSKEITINVDSVGQKVDSSAKNLLDTAKKDLKNLKNSIQLKVETKDSSK